MTHTYSRLTSHCAKVQKYKQGKIGLQFLICGANNVVEHRKKLQSSMGVQGEFSDITREFKVKLFSVL